MDIVLIVLSVVLLLVLIVALLILVLLILLVLILVLILIVVLHHNSPHTDIVIIQASALYKVIIYIQKSFYSPFESKITSVVILYRV